MWEATGGPKSPADTEPGDCQGTAQSASCSAAGTAANDPSLHTMEAEAAAKANAAAGGSQTTMRTHTMSTKDGVRLGVGAVEAGAGLATTATAGGAAIVCVASVACGGGALTLYTLAAIGGAISTQDGITQMDNAITGEDKPSFLGAVGSLIDGDRGRALGEFFGNLLGLAAGAKGAAGVVEGRIAEGIDAVTAVEDQVNQ